MGSSNNVANFVKQVSNDAATPTAADVDNCIRTRSFTFMKPSTLISGDDSGIAVDITETGVWVNRTGNQVSVISADYVCGATGITAADATASSLNLFKRDAAGANQVALGTMTTATVGGGGVGNLTTGQKGAFTLSAVAGALQVPNGGVITFSRTHVGAGLVIPGGPITVRYTED